MTKRILKTALPVLVLFGTATMASPLFAQKSEDKTDPAIAQAVPSTALQTDATKAAPAPSAEDMQKMMAQMMELSKLGENHKLLADLAGTWNFTVKMWMNGDPTSKADESKGVATRKAVMDGRFYVLDVAGKMQMPGPDGKLHDTTFKGMGLEGYDNVKKKFIGTWCDNMGTGIMMSEGDYDPATKTFTYRSEFEGLPGMKQKVREVIKITDKDHHIFEWYEDRGGSEVKTMEIAYTRKK